MEVSPSHSRPVDVFLASRARDLPTLKLAISGLRDFCAVQDIIVAARSEEVLEMQRRLGDAAQVWDENKMIPGMTIDELRKLPITSFPKGAGWYYQQLLKYAFCFHRETEDDYLIWDGDTIPLRPMEFFDPQGRLIFTKGNEYHAPYFETYQRLLGCDASYEFSFISQHMPVRKSHLREMLALIEQRVPSEGNWAWKIMRSLPSQGINLFSEYETFGHYMKQRHPDETVFRDVPWLREGTKTYGFPPKKRDLRAMAKNYFFVAFEARDYWPIRLKRAIYSRLKLS